MSQNRRSTVPVRPDCPAAQDSFQFVLTVVNEQTRGGTVAQPLCISCQGHIPPTIDEFVSGCRDSRIDGPGDLPETFSVSLRQNAGARGDRFRPLSEAPAIFRYALFSTGLLGQHQVV